MRLLFALVFLIVPSCTANTQKPVIVPGTHVSITPPPGWASSEVYSGFLDKGSGAVIVVSETAGAPYSETSAGFTTQEMAKRGMELVSKTPVVFGSHKGMLLAIRQAASGVNYAKWMACFGDESQTVIIVATAREVHQAQLRDAVIASLKTARIVAGAATDPFDGLLFVMQAKEPYRLAKRISSTLIFTHKGEIPSPSPTAPVFVAGSSLGRPPVADQEAFARSRVKQTATLTNINVYDAQKMALDGLTGIQLAATATDTETKTPMLVYQVMLFDKDVYYIMQGIAAQKAPAELPIWFEMVKSFKRKTNSSAKP